MRTTIAAEDTKRDIKRGQGSGGRLQVGCPWPCQKGTNYVGYNMSIAIQLCVVSSASNTILAARKKKKRKYAREYMPN